MSNTSKLVFNGLMFFSWIIFIGLCIEAGALIINFVFSIYKPEFVSNLYEKLDLSELYERSKWAFYAVYSLVLSIAILKANLFYVVTRMITYLDLTKPFNNSVAKQILQISQYTLGIGLISFVTKQTVKNLAHRGFQINGLERFWADSQAFILMAGVIYIIAIIFAKGVELQNENELTV